MFYLGVDLGQRQDHTAMAVVERGTGPVLLLRSVTRVPLVTLYPEIVERVRQTVQHRLLAGRCAVTVDATGVGPGGGSAAGGAVGMVPRWSVPKRN